MFRENQKLISCLLCNYLGDGGSLAPEVAESFANTLRINKFIAGVSGGQHQEPEAVPGQVIT